MDGNISRDYRGVGMSTFYSNVAMWESFDNVRVGRNTSVYVNVCVFIKLEMMLGY